MKKIIKQKWFTLGLVPFALFLLGVALILFYNPYASFSVLRYGQAVSDKIYGKEGELLGKEKIYGEFTAQDNYLGIVLFNLNTFNRTNTDTIEFKFKEKTAKNWYAINGYKVDKFQNGFNYPFGFPPIKDSKGKTYYFEIRSLYGEEGNAIGINRAISFISTEYVFPRSVYSSNKQELVSFVIKKFINMFTNPLFYPILVLYLFPFLFYFLIPFSKKKKLLGKYILFFPLIVLMLLDKFLVDKVVDLITFELQIFWIILIIIYKWESSVTFLFSLIFVLMLPFLIFMNLIEIAEKIAIQAYFFLAIAVFQLFLEVIFDKNNRVTHREFIKWIVGFIHEIR